MALRQSPTQASDADLIGAFASLTKEPVELSPEYAAQLRQLMQSEIRAQQEQRVRWPWAHWRDGLTAWAERPFVSFRFAMAMTAAVAFLVVGVLLMQRLYPAINGSHAATVSVDRGKIQVIRSVYVFGDVALTRRLDGLVGDTQPLRAWDRVVSDPGTEAQILFSDGSRAVLGPETEIQMRRLQERTSSSPLAIAMRLERGSVRSEVEDLQPDVDEFRLSTPNLVAQVRGTVFRVDVRPDSTRIATDEGVVRVNFDGRFADVRAGQELSVSKALLAESPPAPRAQAPQLILNSKLPSGAMAENEHGELTFFSNETTTSWQIRTMPSAQVEFYINDELVKSIKADVNGLAFIDFSPPDEGTFRITAIAETLTGEKSLPSAAHTLVIDRTPPHVVLTSPEDPQVSTPTLAIAGHTEPDVTLELNGSRIAVDEAGGFQASLSLVSGPNELALVATDRAGNAFRSQSVVVLE